MWCTTIDSKFWVGLSLNNGRTNLLLRFFGFDRKRRCLSCVSFGLCVVLLGFVGELRCLTCVGGFVVRQKKC
jgi:hypothetical protein